RQCVRSFRSMVGRSGRASKPGDSYPRYSRWLSCRCSPGAYLRRPGGGRELERLGAALRGCLKEGYGAADLRRDLLAGTVVGIVALPLSMALARASGLPPPHGLYTAIVAGLVIAPLGGSRVQVSGPTAAFVVILAPITSRFGLGGLLLAGAMAGVLLVVMGLARMGQLIEFVPHPVTT